jgi:hypothetical protein
MAIIVETWMAQDLVLGTGAVVKTHPGGGSLPGHAISLSSFSTVGAAGTGTEFAWTALLSIDSGSFQSVDVTVAGAELGDFALVSFDLDTEDMQLTAQVTAANTVTCTFYNLFTQAVDLGTGGTLKVLAFKTR